MRILVIEPRKPVAGRPGLLDLHGGGYVAGNPEVSAAFLLDALVLKFGFTAVSVDYRLAPGTRYPGSLHDNYAALKWFHANAAGMGVDPGRIATIGLSAGGGHAAALALFARDHGEVPILFQLLLCPMLDDRTGSAFRDCAGIGSPFFCHRSIPYLVRDGIRVYGSSNLGASSGAENRTRTRNPNSFSDFSI